MNKDHRRQFVVSLQNFVVETLGLSLKENFFLLLVTIEELVLIDFNYIVAFDKAVLRWRSP